jgi:hypothetical protein
MLTSLLASNQRWSTSACRSRILWIRSCRQAVGSRCRFNIFGSPLLPLLTTILVSHGVFNALLVAVLEALRQGKLEEDSIGGSGGLDQAKLAITTSITLLEYHSKVNEAASLYLKVGRSLYRSLGRVLAAKISGFGHGTELASGNYPPQPQHQSPQYRWPVQQSGLQSQPPNIFDGLSPGLQPDNTGKPFRYFTFGSEQESDLYNPETLSYSHASAVPNWHPPGFGMDESIDPSLLESGQGFPQQGKQ